MHPMFWVSPFWLNVVCCLRQMTILSMIHFIYRVWPEADGILLLTLIANLINLANDSMHVATGTIYALHMIFYMMHGLYTYWSTMPVLLPKFYCSHFHAILIPQSEGFWYTKVTTEKVLCFHINGMVKYSMYICNNFLMKAS